MHGFDCDIPFGYQHIKAFVKVNKYGEVTDIEFEFSEMDYCHDLFEMAKDHVETDYQARIDEIVECWADDELAAEGDLRHADRFDVV